MEDRELTAGEERLVEELELDRELFLGVRLDADRVQRRAPYFIVERTPLSLDQAVLPQIHGLELSKNPRFGNYMIALSHLLVLAQRLGIVRVFLPAHPLFRSSFVIQGVLFTQSHPHHTTLRGVFFNLGPFKPLLQDSPKPVEVMHLFRAALLPISGDGALRSVKVKASLLWRSLTKRLNQELTIHIRSGDIFSNDNPHPGYWQPPLDFYTTVITAAKPKKVILVFEDTANPVVPALIEWLRSMGTRHHIEDGPIEAAIRELATAWHVVGGRGSFLVPILAMNRSVERITFFGGGIDAHEPRVRRNASANKGRLRVTTVSAGDYVKRVSPWIGSPEQRDAMLRYRLSTDQQAALRLG